jgi:hypothetical protein
MTFLKPKDQKKTRPGIRVNRDGSEVCLTKAQWDKRRWELYVIAHNDGGSCCFKCGCKLDFGENFHAHHSRGTRGMGGGLRDDRIFIPYTGEVHPIALCDEYEYMPAPPEGMQWNLYPLCNNCHQEIHEQGCDGKLHWSGNALDHSSTETQGDRTQEARGQTSFNLTTDGDQPEDSQHDPKGE